MLSRLHALLAKYWRLYPLPFPYNAGLHSNCSIQSREVVGVHASIKATIVRVVMCNRNFRSEILPDLLTRMKNHLLSCVGVYI
jgi:hypothetical protein